MVAEDPQRKEKFYAGNYATDFALVHVGVVRAQEAIILEGDV
jgi:hypothetical protein